ncbi:MAG: hypothetical protein M1816_001925 [Peltula sp. TS41687]|nr:MAG: hypothetical protein M1816_001925 [Peltula sp. TS41687]
MIPREDDFSKYAQRPDEASAKRTDLDLYLGTPQMTRSAAFGSELLIIYNGSDIWTDGMVDKIGDFEELTGR